VQKDVAIQYTAPAILNLNQWALSGTWQVSAQSAALKTSGGTISYRFHGRDLHLVLGTKSEMPIRYKVLLDGKAPGAAHGVDIDAQGNGEIHEQRLYQLIRQPDASGEHEFKIEFLDAGAEAFAFTFG
jgi:hypothetical protein